MSANVVIDTNVLLLADTCAECNRVVTMLQQQPNDYVLFLDRDRKIDQEYLDYAQKANDVESTISLFVKWLNERESNQVNRLHSQINGAAIFPEPCRQTAEAPLIGIACGQPNTFLVIPEQRHIADERIKRCYREADRLKHLCEHLEGTGKPLHLLASDEHDTLTELVQLNIRSYDQLYDFLQRHRVDPKSAERTSIELKCPQDEGLVALMVNKIMQALCGMLNSLEGNGYVFVGVEDGDASNLTLKGIALRFNYKDKPTWDELKRDMMNSLNHFNPHIPNRIDFEVIPDLDNPKRGILAFRVRPERSDRGYTYQDIRYVRIGESTRKEL